MDLTPDNPQISSLLDKLSLEEKVALVTGHDFWSTVAIEHIGLRSIVFSDGPSGVRGPVWDERSPSLNLPSATALASSWDPEIAYQYGEVSADEAKRKGVDVVLGPTINLHRSPLNGRHFECFSEDPTLTANLATSYVQGAQDQGVGATLKHYVANDWETDRHVASSDVSERALRELYLLAFERPVREGNAWLVMSSYNKINGVSASEHELLETPLNSEWGFGGVVISDWGGVYSVDAGSAAQDLAMPGPESVWSKELAEAVRAGHVAEEAVDRKVRRLLVLAVRVGALENAPASQRSRPVEIDGLAFTRRAAIEGSVLLENDGTLPLAPENVTRVAVIGQSAQQARTQGGGSATVVPESVVSPLEGIREAYPNAVIDYQLGAVADEELVELPLSQISNPRTGEQGALVRFLDSAGAEMHYENRRATTLMYFGGDAPVGSATTFELTTTWTPAVSSEIELGFSAVGHAVIEADGAVILDEHAEAVGEQLGASLLNPPSRRARLEVQSGVALTLRLVFDLTSRARMDMGAFGLTFGTAPARTNEHALRTDAAVAAKNADVAVVVVGTNSNVESEGFDRSALSLPGDQDALVDAVASTGTPTVVIVNAGSPVLMPWRDKVSSVLLTYFGGQQMGHAIGDVLTGSAEPGGRLPTTWPATEAETPILHTEPVEGSVEYSEGIHIGHRAWLKEQSKPAYWFGHGLGYTTWELDSAEIPDAVSAGGEVMVGLKMTNIGERAGKQIVQIYLSRQESAVDRPVRWLVGHAVMRADAGKSVQGTVQIPARAFSHWEDGRGWQTEPGVYTVHVGTSVGCELIQQDIALTNA